MNKFIFEKCPFIEEDRWFVYHSIRDDFHRILIAEFQTKELAEEYVNWKNKQ